MPFAGEGPTCAYNTNGKVYCTGGNSGNGFASYDIGTDTWTTLASIPTGDTYGSASGSMGDNVYVVGGGSSGPSSGTYVYSISGGSWTSGNAAPSPYLLGGYNIAGNYLYLVGSYGASPLSGGRSASSVLNGAKSAHIQAPDSNTTAVQQARPDHRHLVHRTDVDTGQGRRRIGIRPGKQHLVLHWWRREQRRILQLDSTGRRVHAIKLARRSIRSIDPEPAEPKAGSRGWVLHDSNGRWRDLEYRRN